ncbi:MAG: helix-turn-helix transcriptional regulator [Coriobacteriia bacterium]|nr:helix-turn-helix transcriptional regulator [Coriobacteriia bacterium]MCL2750187.1 helix-turn-helix transcriptional regulator [Coriobacteriia bacterium]
MTTSRDRKTDDLDRFLDEQLKNPSFAEEWERSKPEYEVMKLLVEARSEMGMSQSELARRTGIKQPNISRLERGVCSPTLDTLAALAHGLGKKLQVSFI